MKEKTESIDKVLQETVNGLHNTGTNLPKPLESKPVISRIAATGNLLNKTVTETVGKTTSEVTNVVNDTVNSVVNELPAIPVVSPVVKDVSVTVKKTTSSVQTVVENPGEFVNETLKTTIDVSADEVIEAVETVDKVTQLPQEIVKDISRNENFSTNFKENSDVGSASKREPIILLAPEIGTDVLSKQGGSSEVEQHNKIGLEDSSMNDEVNLVVDSMLEETSVDRQPVFQEVKVLEQANGLIDPFVTSKTDVLENKNVDNPNLPTESSQKWDRQSPAVIMGAPPPTESLNMAMGGQSDLIFWGIVDMFTLQSSNGGKWIYTNEYAMVKWAHAPPGRPPQQPSFFNV
ncbi:hypothetical protein [Sporosarcina sp. JAI121]|uniref:hypothetical protein n=1 Tax=Sporosarcina sp. JAI121 TaxID=2723064 RepID=UPI0015CE3C85|nr:hypothetical protein [Sporosarcina sp. JAI121]